MNLRLDETGVRVNGEDQNPVCSLMHAMAAHTWLKCKLKYYTWERVKVTGVGQGARGRRGRGVI